MPTYLSCQKAILDLIAGWKICPHLESKFIQGYLNKLVLVPTLSFSLNCFDFFLSLAFISFIYLWQAILISLDLCFARTNKPNSFGTYPHHKLQCSADPYTSIKPSSSGPKDTEYRTIPKAIILLLPDLTQKNKMLLETT